MFRLFSKSKPAKGKKRRSGSKSKPTTAQSAGKKEELRPKTEIKNAVQAETSKSAPRSAKREMTPERERLIRNALLVHASQTKVLDELDDDLKERLRALAVEKLLGGDDGTRH